MTLIGLGLTSGAALLLSALAGPAPRDATTHKPSPEQCAAAARGGSALPGCESTVSDDDARRRAEEEARRRLESEAQRRREQEQSSRAEAERRERERFMVCPQDPRCPR